MTKFCPTCQTRYHEEIVRFCTKDGTPLVAESEPKFTSLPSEESLLDIGEETIVRTPRPKVPAVPPPSVSSGSQQGAPSQRIFIPTTETPRESPQAPAPQTRMRPPQQTSGVGKFVALGGLGTLAVILSGFGVWWLLQGTNSTITNTNYSSNINANSNANILFGAANLDNSFSNFNLNANTNVNANLKTPTPKPTPSKTPTPKPSPSPLDSNLDSNANSNSNRAIIVNSNVSTPVRTPTPVTPKPTPSATPPNQPVNAGVLNSRAKDLPKPAYPPIARQMNASGQVSVQVLLDEEGNVVSAKAVSGHALLRAPSEAAARQSRFYPVMVGGRPVKAIGVIVYNFIRNQ